MAPVKDLANKIVVTSPISWRITGGILASGGVAFFLFLMVGGWNTKDYLMMGISLTLLVPSLIGLFMFGYTIRITLDDISGNVRIRNCIGCFTYKTRSIAKRDIRSATASAQRDEYDFGGWVIWLWMNKTNAHVKISNISRRSAKHLADRINAFVHSK